MKNALVESPLAKKIKRTKSVLNAEELQQELDDQRDQAIQNQVENTDVIIDEEPKQKPKRKVKQNPTVAKSEIEVVTIKENPTSTKVVTIKNESTPASRPNRKTKPRKKTEVVAELETPSTPTKMPNFNPKLINEKTIMVEEDANVYFKKYNVSIAIELITPEIATEALANFNGANRPVSRRNIYVLEDQIKNNWMFNGVPLIYAEDLSLVDGQHRYLACANTGIPFVALVVRGVQKKAFTTVDQQHKRTLSDFIATGTQATLYREKAHVSNNLFYFEEYEFSPNCKKKHTITPVHALAFYKKHEDEIVSAVDYIVDTYGKKALPLSVARLSFTYLILSRIDNAQAKEFLRQLITGAQIPEGSPIIPLKAVLVLEMKEYYKYRNATMLIQDLIFRVWNMYRSDKVSKNAMKSIKLNLNLIKTTLPK